MYDINADFRTGIKLEMTAISQQDDTEKLMQILLLYYGDIACVPADVGAAFTAVMDFFITAKKTMLHKAARRPTGAHKSILLSMTRRISMLHF